MDTATHSYLEAALLSLRKGGDLKISNFSDDAIQEAREEVSAFLAEFPHLAPWTAGDFFLSRNRKKSSLEGEAKDYAQLAGRKSMYIEGGKIYFA
jgi:hypothetical protein